VHSAWEVLIAEALRRRGARPTVFVCSGGLALAPPGRIPACGISSVHEDRFLSCRDCCDLGLAAAGAFDLPVVRLDQLLDEGRQRDLFAFIDGLERGALSGLEHRGFPVARLANKAARWYLCADDLDAQPNGFEVFRAFVKSAAAIAEVAGPLFDRVRPDIIFALNGLFFAERVLEAEAERRGIRVVSYESGYVPETLFFSEGMANHYDISAQWERLKDVPLSAAQESALDGYLEDRRKGRRSTVNLWPTRTEDAEAVQSSLGLDRSRPIVTLFTNLTWDSAAQDRDVGFTSMYEWIVESIRLFGKLRTAQLVVRIHPGEIQFPGWETRDPVLARLQRTLPVMPENVRIVPPENDLSSYTLMGLSRCGLVYTTTAGLEMALEGKPVVVAGDTHYARKGFTLDPKTPGEYEEMVGRALSSPPEPAVRDLARRYAHALFFRYFLRFPIVSLAVPDLVPKVRPSAPGILDPGGDRTLDLICNGILHRGEFFADG
jgi:hypothetical protein